MDMSKPLYLIPLKTQFTLKLQMQYYRISYFSSLKVLPEGECVVKALFKNKIVPAGSFYFVCLALSSQDLQRNLLNLYSSVTFPSLKNSEKRSRSSWSKGAMVTPQEAFVGPAQCVWLPPTVSS